MASATALTSGGIRPWKLLSVFTHNDTVSVIHRLCSRETAAVVSAADFACTAAGSNRQADCVAAAVEFAAKQAESPVPAPEVADSTTHEGGVCDQGCDAASAAHPVMVMLPDFSRLGYQVEASTLELQAALHDAFVEQGMGVFVNSNESTLGEGVYYNMYKPFASQPDVLRVAREQLSSDDASAAQHCKTAGQMAAAYASRHLPEDVAWLHRECAAEAGQKPMYSPRCFVDNYGFEGDDWTARWDWAKHKATYEKPNSTEWIQGVNLAISNAHDRFEQFATPPAGSKRPPAALAPPHGVTLASDDVQRAADDACRRAVAAVLSWPQHASSGSSDADDGEGKGKDCVADVGQGMLTAGSAALLACARMSQTLQTRECETGRGALLVLPKHS